jgi:hypothetical protein
MELEQERPVENTSEEWLIAFQHSEAIARAMQSV